MRTRIEILKNNTWVKLRLKDSGAVKYNAVINKIGRLNTREIGHTNTFSIPYMHENIQALGLNVFNKSELAIALNKKYPAKYYIEDKLLQAGFVVINNTKQDAINLNFLDEGLSILDKWGSVTYAELLKSTELSIPADYQTAINEMKTYVLSQSALAPSLSTVGSRGYNLALFPNNLNCIGDGFQIQSGGSRLNDSFNPYQSRPIYNAKALFDLAVESYGFTPIYDNSIDWSRVEKTYIISENANKGLDTETALSNIDRSLISSVESYYSIFIPEEDPRERWTYENTFVYTPATSLRPIDIPTWVSPPGVTTGYESRYCVYQPLVTPAGNVGIIKITADSDYNLSQLLLLDFYTVWENATPGGDVFFYNILPDVIDETIGGNLQYSYNKSNLDSPPPGVGSFIGIFMHFTSLQPNEGGGVIRNILVNETFLNSSEIAFDEDSQFLGVNLDLLYSSPNQTIKNLLKGLMQKEGILINIDTKNQEIKFFSYGAYLTQKNLGNYDDWSSYSLKHSTPIYNTDYGSEYAKKNEIGLSSPYRGNVANILLDIGSDDSKYKDFATNYVEGFGDVTKVVRINNTNNPYFEFTNEGLGLVEEAAPIVAGVSTPFTQVRADGSSQGTFTTLTNIQNVNYATIPQGLIDWYNVVDKAVRVEDEFLLPVSVIKDTDLSRPIYVDKLGGYFIIEEISQYVDDSTPTVVKLIKLIL